jgi:hypothetical protein
VNQAKSRRNPRDELKKYKTGIAALQEEINGLTVLKII